MSVAGTHECLSQSHDHLHSITQHCLVWVEGILHHAILKLPFHCIVCYKAPFFFVLIYRKIIGGLAFRNLVKSKVFALQFRRSWTSAVTACTLHPLEECS